MLSSKSPGGPDDCCCCCCSPFLGRGSNSENQPFHSLPAGMLLSFSEKPLSVWITLAAPLIAGIILVWTLPHTRLLATSWADYINRIVRLDWLFRVAWWGADRTSTVWGNALRVVEGAGYIGWLMVLVLIGYLVMQ